MKYHLENQRVAIVGLARTGVATARFCLDQGAHLTVYEMSRPKVKPEIVEELEARGARVCFGDGNGVALGDIDLVVPSPGVPPHAPILTEASRLGIPIVSEVELAAGFTDRLMVAVTGTNGKTTTVTLIGQILEAAGFNPDVVGNIGRPLIEAIRSADTGPLVVEVSSFQLEYTAGFRPAVAVFLNLTNDHADWHGGPDAYQKAKLKIFQAQKVTDLAIINESLRPVVGETSARLIVFGGKRGVFIHDGWICQDFTSGAEKIVSLDRLLIEGAHNHENVMAAICAALALDVPVDVIAAVVMEFSGVEHRLEFTGDHGGVRFYNDSKATNPAAAARAVTAFRADVVLLAGGRNKGNEFDELAAHAVGRVKLAILFGEAAGDIGRAFANRGIPVKRCVTLAEAVSLARGEVRAGDVVLLSPACASFDMFRDYEERGRAFKDLVAAKVSAIG